MATPPQRSDSFSDVKQRMRHTNLLISQLDRKLASQPANVGNKRAHQLSQTQWTSFEPLDAPLTPASTDPSADQPSMQPSPCRRSSKRPHSSLNDRNYSDLSSSNGASFGAKRPRLSQSDPFDSAMSSARSASDLTLRDSSPTLDLSTDARMQESSMRPGSVLGERSSDLEIMQPRTEPQSIVSSMSKQRHISQSEHWRPLLKSCRSRGRKTSSETLPSSEGSKSSADIDTPASSSLQILSKITTTYNNVKVTGIILKQDKSTEIVAAGELPPSTLEGVQDVLQTCQQQGFEWDEITDSEQCVRQAALRRNDQKTKFHPKEGARVSCQTCANSNKACMRRVGPNTIAIVALPTPLRPALNKDDPALWIRSEGGRTSMKLWRE